MWSCRSIHRSIFNRTSAKYYGNDAGTTIPMSTGFDQWCWGQNIFYAGFGFTNWPNDVINDLVLTPDGTVDFVCDNDEYRAAITYFHDWYAEGLMDVEMFSQSDTQLISKCSQGYVGVSTWWYIGRNPQCNCSYRRRNQQWTVEYYQCV